MKHLTNQKSILIKLTNNLKQLLLKSLNKWFDEENNWKEVGKQFKKKTKRFFRWKNWKGNKKLKKKH